MFIFVYDNNPAKYPEALGIFTVDVTPFDLFSLIACEKGLKASLGSNPALYVSERISIVSGKAPISIKPNAEKTINPGVMYLPSEFITFSETLESISSSMEIIKPSSTKISFFTNPTFGRNTFPPFNKYMSSA